MDIISNLPVEVSIDIFTYLTPKELAKCFAVSKTWRTIANVNILWKKHCKRNSVNLNQYSFFYHSGGSLGPMADWARTFAGWSLRRLQNWRKNCKYIHVIAAWNRTVTSIYDSILAYTGELEVVFIYELSDQIRYVQTVHLIPEDPVTSLNLTSDHLVVRQDDMFTIYNKSGDNFNLEGFLIYYDSSYIFTRHYYLSQDNTFYVRHCTLDSALCVLSDLCLYILSLSGRSLHTFKVGSHHFFHSDHNRVYVATGAQCVSGFDSNCNFADFFIDPCSVIGIKSNSEFTVALVSDEDFYQRYYVFKTWSKTGCPLKEFKTPRSFGFEISQNGFLFASVANDKFGQRVFVTLYDVDSCTKSKTELYVSTSLAQAKLHFIGQDLLYVVTRRDWGSYDRGYLIELSNMTVLYELESDFISVVAINSRQAVYHNGEHIEIHLYNSK